MIGHFDRLVQNSSEFISGTRSDFGMLRKYVNLNFSSLWARLINTCILITELPLLFILYTFNKYTMSSLNVCYIKLLKDISYFNLSLARLDFWFFDGCSQKQSTQQCTDDSIHMMSI